MLPMGMINVEFYHGNELVGAAIMMPPMHGDVVQLIEAPIIVGGNPTAQLFEVVSDFRSKTGRTHLVPNRAGGFPDEACIMMRISVEPISEKVNMDVTEERVKDPAGEAEIQKEEAELVDKIVDEQPDPEIPQ